MNKNSNSVRQKKSLIIDLLKEIKGYNFRIRAICVNKLLITSNELKNKQNSFYNYMIKEVLAKTDSLTNATVKLDGHSGREYKKSAKTYFCREINSKANKIKKLKFVDSKTDNLIQLADVVAGSILRSCDASKTDSKKYLSIIQKRVEDIWTFK